MSLPTQPLSLIRSNQTEDVAALSIVHNKNAKAIEEYFGRVVEYLSTLNADVSLSQEAFNALLVTAKNSVLLSVSMVNGDTVSFNEYVLTRIGVPLSYTAPAIEFRITDSNVARNTDFKKVIFVIKSLEGQQVFPIITSTTSYISIIFNDVSDVTQTTFNATTDPNNKRIIFL